MFYCCKNVLNYKMDINMHITAHRALLMWVSSSMHRVTIKQTQVLFENALKEVHSFAT